MPETAERWIIHVDLDAFFCSVEELLNPDLRGKPVLVGGDPNHRGVVSSASYAARAYGIHSAMPMAQALKLCPHAIVLPARHQEYRRRSRHVMDLLREITPDVEPISIDEAFLDITGCQRLWGSPEEIGRLVRRRIRVEQHLPASVGIARNKLVAKIACDRGKPDGLTLVPAGEEEAFLAPLPIEELWGVGQVTGQKLRGLGIVTIGDLVAWGEERLIAIFGESHGQGLYRRAGGIDTSPVCGDVDRRSISQERTFSRDTADEHFLHRVLLSMSEEVAARLRRRDLVAQTVRVKMRYSDFATVTRQVTLEQPTDQALTIFEEAQHLLKANWQRRQPLRLLGLGVEGLLENAGYQLDLFAREDQRRIRLSRTLDDIRERFGREAITRASLLRERRGPGTHRTPGPGCGSGATSVPEEGDENEH